MDGKNAVLLPFLAMERAELVAQGRNQRYFHEIVFPLRQRNNRFVCQHVGGRLAAVHADFRNAKIPFYSQFRSFRLAENMRAETYFARKIRKSFLLKRSHRFGRNEPHERPVLIHGKIPREIDVFQFGIVPQTVAHALGRFAIVQSPEHVRPFIKIQFVHIFVFAFADKTADVRLFETHVERTVVKN